MFAQQPTMQGDQAAMQGVAIVANLRPDELRERLSALDWFADLVFNNPLNCCYVRIRLRAARHEPIRSRIGISA